MPLSRLVFGVLIAGVLLSAASGRKRAARSTVPSHVTCVSRREIVRAERTRIADHLHDIVGNRITQVLLHTSILRRTPNDRARNASITAIEDAARAAMVDLRRLLRVVSSPSRDHANVHEHAALTREITVIVDELRAAGFRAAASVAGMTDLPTAVECALVRTLREGATNVVKHARPSCNVTINGSATDTTVRLEIANDRVASSRVKGFSSARFGLARGRERARLLGGSLEAGRAGRGWLTVIRLPLDPK